MQVARGIAMRVKACLSYGAANQSVATISCLRNLITVKTFDLASENSSVRALFESAKVPYKEIRLPTILLASLSWRAAWRW